MRPRILIAGLAAAALFSPLPSMAQAPAKGAQAQTAPDLQAFDRQLAEAQAQMRKMQEQMEHIRQTQDPQERQRLLQEHWTTMQSAMATMRGMWGPGMMGGPGGMHGRGMMGGPGMMGWRGMHSDYSRITPEQLKQRQYMMNQYMGMQQMMMDQMLDRQQWMMQPPAAPPK